MEEFFEANMTVLEMEVEEGVHPRKGSQPKWKGDVGGTIGN